MYPSKRDITIVKAYSEDACIYDGPKHAFDIKNYPKGTVYYTVVEESAYRKACEDYKAEEGRLADKFKADLFAENNLEADEAANEAYRLAWEEGHSNGFSEIAIYFNDLANLIHKAREGYEKK
jgi:flagellar biosynthesis/type III secretory pathway protein FliH